MRNSVWIAGMVVLAAGLLSAACSGSDTPSPKPPPQAKSAAPPPPAQKPSPPAPARPTRRVPPYFNSAEAAKPFPRLLPASYFRNRPIVARAYQIAHQIPGVLAQQPCYCYCDRAGHRSLLDCYASDHGARCLNCIKEAFLAAQLTKQGKKPAQIRDAIIRGEWRTVDLFSAMR